MIEVVIVVTLVLTAAALWLIADESNDDEYGIKR